jgi:glycosidase
MRAFVPLILCACSATTTIEDLRAGPHQANTDLDWRDQMVYQILVDRFADGDPNNDRNVAPSVPGRFHGGDWQGVIDHLDYLSRLGVTALWISPVVKNIEDDAGFDAYHGYWTQDPLRPNPHFGDLMKLRELVQKAHARGMLVLLDVVTNHVGQLFYYDINGNGQPDDFISGGGTSHTCVQICNNPARASECSPDEKIYCQKGVDYFERILEWDPEYDPRGIQGWTSEGFSGPATIIFPNWPDRDRVPPDRPPAWFGWSDDKAWFDDPSWYHRKGRVYVWWHESDYSRDFVRDQEVTGDFPGGLRDLDTDNPDVQDAMIRIFEYWMDVADFDGFRIDTLKHVDRPEKDPNVRGFWGEFTDRMRAHAAGLGKQSFFMFGEAFDGDDTLIGSYTFPGIDARGPFGRLDSVFYFSQKYRVVDEVFKQAGPTRNVACMLAARFGTAQTDTFCADHGFPAGPTYHNQPHASRAAGGTGLAPQQSLVNFLDNHDLSRFLWDSPVAALHNALVYLYTWDGIPCLYYGTEQEFHGGNDPDNREDMVFDETNGTFQWIQQLIAVRKQHVALRHGQVVMRATSDTGAGLLAYERVDPSERVLVVLNTADADLAATTVPTGFATGTTLHDALDASVTYTVGAGGTISVTLPARVGHILY